MQSFTITEKAPTRRFQPGEGPSTDLRTFSVIVKTTDGSFAALSANVIVDMDTNYWDLQAAANKCEYASCEPENKWKK